MSKKPIPYRLECWNSYDYRLQMPKGFYWVLARRGFLVVRSWDFPTKEKAIAAGKRFCQQNKIKYRLQAEATGGEE
jgi:hypothetical protein